MDPPPHKKEHLVQVVSALPARISGSKVLVHGRLVSARCVMLVRMKGV